MLIRRRQPDAKSCSATSTARCADRAADDAEPDAAFGKAVEVCVVARPGLILLRAPVSAQAPDDVAIGIEDADAWNAVSRPPCA